jgi:hypothetical protein
MSSSRINFRKKMGKLQTVKILLVGIITPMEVLKAVAGYFI